MLYLYLFFFVFFLYLILLYFIRCNFYFSFLFFTYFPLLLYHYYLLFIDYLPFRIIYLVDLMQAFQHFCIFYFSSFIIFSEIFNILFIFILSASRIRLFISIASMELRCSPVEGSPLSGRFTFTFFQSFYFLLLFLNIDTIYMFHSLHLLPL